MAVIYNRRRVCKLCDGTVEILTVHWPSRLRTDSDARFHRETSIEHDRMWRALLDAVLTQNKSGENMRQAALCTGAQSLSRFSSLAAPIPKL